MNIRYLLKPSMILFLFLVLGHIFLWKIHAIEKFPKWIDSVPNEIGYYFFLGKSNGTEKEQLLDEAKQDALAQLMLYMNASISIDIPFDLLYQQKLPIHFAKLKQSYTAMNLTTQSFVDGFRITHQFCPHLMHQKTKQCFVLGKIPILLIKKSMQRLRNLHSKFKKKSLLIISFIANPFDENTILKWEQYHPLSQFLTDFYQSQGYAVIPVNHKKYLAPILNWKRDLDKLVSQIPEGVTDLVYVTIQGKQISPPKSTPAHLVEVEGTLTLKQVDLLTGEIKYIKQLKSTASSLHDRNLAFEKMKQNLLSQIVPSEWISLN